MNGSAARLSPAGDPRPVNAERLGPVSDVTTYRVFTRAAEGKLHEGPAYEVPKYPYGARASQGAGAEERGARREHLGIIQRLLKTLVEERSLVLSGQPEVFAGMQPSAWRAQMELFLEQTHVP